MDETILTIGLILIGINIENDVILGSYITQTQNILRL